MNNTGKFNKNGDKKEKGNSQTYFFFTLFDKTIIKSQVNNIGLSHTLKQEGFFFSSLPNRRNTSSDAVESETEKEINKKFNRWKS